MAADLFAAVPEHELRAAARRRRFDRGEVVFHRDDPGDSLHRVELGRFAVRIITPLGDTATIALVGPGDVFGLMAVLGAAPRRTATVVALEQSETLAIATSVFFRLRAAYPEIRDAVDQLVISQLAQTSDRLVEALYTPSTTRVRNRLNDLARLYGDPARDEVVIPLSQEHLAGLAGTTRETVNRVLKHEQQLGTVELGRNRIVVKPAPVAHRRPDAPGTARGNE
jgi:CRP/FNR family transcriptional regulator, cyclic AMP receptor protein